MVQKLQAINRARAELGAMNEAERTRVIKEANQIAASQTVVGMDVF